MTLKEYYESLYKQRKDNAEINTSIGPAGSSEITQEHYREITIKNVDLYKKIRSVFEKAYDTLTVDQRKALESDLCKNEKIKKQIENNKIAEAKSTLKKFYLDFESDYNYRGSNYQEFLEVVKPLIDNNIQQEINETLEKGFDERIHHLFGVYHEDIKDDFFKYVPQDREQEIINEVEAEKSYVEKEFEKDYNPEVLKAIENAQSDEEKAILEEINEEVLATFSPSSIDNISSLAESEGKFVGMNQVEHLISYAQKTPILQGKININAGNIFVNADESGNSKEYFEANDKLKYKLSEEKKEILIHIMKFFTDTVDLEGNKLFLKGEISGDQKTKIYSYKPYVNNRNRTIDLIKRLNGSNLTPQERQNVMHELQNRIDYKKDLDVKFKEIYKYLKDVGIKKFPDNVTVSRNGEMPEFAIRNYDIDSILNGCYYTYGLIEQSNKTPEEFFENINESIKEMNERDKNFKSITDGINKLSMYDSLALLESPGELIKISSNYISSNLFIRPLGSVVAIEDDPELYSENTAKFEYQNRIMPERFNAETSKFCMAYVSLNEDEKLNTIKNFICAKGDDIPSVSLIAGVNDLYCPISGNKVDNFNRTEYMNKDDVDLAKISTNIMELRNKLLDKANKSKTKTLNPVDTRMMQACKEVRREILAKDILNNPKLKEIYDTKIFKASTLVENKRGDLSFETFANQRFNAAFGQKLDENNFVNSMIMVKAMSEKVRGMGFFKRHFSKEGKSNKAIYNSMKNKIYESGYNKNTLYDFLAENKKLDVYFNDFKNDNGVEKSIINERKSITVKEINTLDKNVDTKKKVINGPEINLENNKELKKELKK